MSGTRAPLRWREHYRVERAVLGDRGLDALLERAPALALPARGAVLIPHVHLSSCGLQVAALANALVSGGFRDVLGIGPLHRLAGALGEEQAALAAGGTCIRSRFTGLHRADGLAADEFCWDGLDALVSRAAARAGVPPPRLHLRAACALPDHPADVPGMPEAQALIAGGAMLVGTIDHIHHGVGYGMAAAEARSVLAEATIGWARERVLGAVAAAGRGALQDLRARCRADRSDGCDVLLTLAHLMPGHWDIELVSCALAPYAETLRAPEPTWVAAALVRIASRPG